MVDTTLRLPRRLSPLRVITARFPQYDVSLFDNTYKLMGWMDTLECGHQVYVCNAGIATPEQAPESGKKRHRCAECAQAQQQAESLGKKPAQSVSAVVRRKKSA